MIKYVSRCLLVCCLLLISSSVSAQQTVYDAEILYSAYRLNPAKLKAEMNSKDIEVYGKVHMKGRVLRIVYFTFETGREQNVVCILGSISDDGYKNLLIGSTISVHGTFNAFPDHIRLTPCVFRPLSPGAVSNK